jgi:hypothetical protein
MSYCTRARVSARDQSGRLTYPTYAQRAKNG